jgi:hypothetical protein
MNGFFSFKKHCKKISHYREQIWARTSHFALNSLHLRQERTTVPTKKKRRTKSGTSRGIPTGASKRMEGRTSVKASSIVDEERTEVVLSAKTHRRVSTCNMRAGRPGASICWPCSSHAPWGWCSLGVPPDLYLVRKVFDVFQLVSCINRHM